jgi:hypothetical protein
MQVDAPKAADHSAYQQIIRPSRRMQAGLKIPLDSQAALRGQVALPRVEDQRALRVA